MGNHGNVCSDRHKSWWLEDLTKHQYIYFLLLWNNELGICFPFTYFCKSKWNLFSSLLAPLRKTVCTVNVRRNVTQLWPLRIYFMLIFFYILHFRFLVVYPSKCADVSRYLMWKTFGGLSSSTSNELYKEEKLLQNFSS